MSFRKIFSSIILSAVLLSLTAVLAGAAEYTEIVSIKPEKGIRSSVATNNTDTRNLETAVTIDGEDAYYSVYSSAASFYPTDAPLEISLAKDADIDSSEYGDIRIVFESCAWEGNDTPPSDDIAVAFIRLKGQDSCLEEYVSFKFENTGKQLKAGTGGGPIYKFTSESVSDILPDGAVISNIVLLPISDKSAYKGAFRLVSLSILASEDPSATTAAPEITAAPETENTAAPEMTAEQKDTAIPAESGTVAEPVEKGGLDMTLVVCAVIVAVGLIVAAVIFAKAKNK